MSDNEKDPNSIFNVNKFNTEYTINGKNVQEFKQAFYDKFIADGGTPEQFSKDFPDWDEFTRIDPSDISPTARDNLSVRNLGTLVDSSDAKGNQGFTVSLMHVPSEGTVFFKAFLTTFNETYKPEWSQENVYGRADGIYMYKSTSRSITVGLTIPASTISEGIENLGKVQQLVQFLYPTYMSADNALTITQSPLMRLKVMNISTTDTTAKNGSGAEINPDQYQNASSPDFINSNKAEEGLLGVLNNLTINYNVENPDFGAFEVAGGTIVPKSIEINFDFTVIHEHHLGWDADNNFSAPNFPYNIDVKGRQQSIQQQANTYALAEARKAREEAAALDKKAKAVATAQEEREKGTMAKIGRWTHQLFNGKDSLTRVQQRSADQISALEEGAQAARDRATAISGETGDDWSGRSTHDLYTDYLID